MMGEVVRAEAVLARIAVLEAENAKLSGVLAKIANTSCACGANAAARAVLAEKETP